MASFVAATKKTKETVSGDIVQEKLESLVKDSDWFAALPEEQQATTLNGLRRIAYMQAASTYASDAGKSVDESRIERMDYETLAESYIGKKIKDAGIETPSEENLKDWFAEFLARMSTVQPYTRNQTPHPNNFYTAEAMAAENELVDYLQKDARTLLEKGADTNHSAELLQKLEKWSNAYVNMPQKPLDIEGEIKMSLQQSYQIYRSIPEHALAIQRVAEKVFGLSPDTLIIIQSGGEASTTEQMLVRTEIKSVREWVVDAASKAIRNETWSPGDVDSKPHMRPAEMEKGILMGRVAIRQQYIHDLAKIAGKLDPQSDAYQEMQATVWKLFNDIKEVYLASGRDTRAEHTIGKIVEQLYPSQFDDEKKEQLRKAGYTEELIQKEEQRLNEIASAPDAAAAKKFLNDLNDIFIETNKVMNGFPALMHKSGEMAQNLGLNIQDELESIKNKALLEVSQGVKGIKGVDFMNKLSGIGESYINVQNYKQGYNAHADKLIADFERLAGLTDIQNIPYEDMAGGLDSTPLRAIDALQMQAKSYGLRAQRITHRQSSEAYAAGMTEIHGVVLRGHQNHGHPIISETYEQGAKELTALYDELKAERKKDEASQDENRIKTLKEEIHEKSVPLTKELITFLTDEANKNDAAIIRKHIQSRTIDHMKNIEVLQRKSDNKEIKLTPNDTDYIFAFESLEMARIGMYSGSIVARELIAEADKPQALWNIFAMQELMKDPDNLPPTKNIPKIVPLVEYVKDIQNLDSMIAEAYAFEPFRKAQEKLTDREDKHSFLKVWDDRKKCLRDMNTEDMLSEMRSSERFGDYMVVNVLRDIAGSIAENDTTLSPMEKEHLEPLRDYLATNTKILNPKADEPLASGSPEREEYYKTAVELAKNNPQMQGALDALVHYAEIMTAGSDATKSGSTGLYTEIGDAVSRSRMELAKLGLFTEQKSGNGSALYRAVINNAIMRMRQGLEMTQGPDILAPETERIRTFRMKNKMGLQAGINEEYRNDAALVNLNNVAGIKDLATDAQYLDIRARDANRVKSYDELYYDPDFSAYVQSCTPMAIQGVFKFAARPPGRITKAKFDVQGMRAIGYGQALGANFGQAHLNHGLAKHILLSDENGFVESEQNKKNAQLYLASPELQNEINRAVHDLAQFDPAAGWKNVEIGINGANKHSCTLSRTTVDDVPMVQIGEDAYQLAQLQDKEIALSVAGRICPDDEAEQKRIASCLRAAAIQDMEMTKSLRAVNAMMVEVEKEIKKTPLSKVPDAAELSSADILVERLQNLSPQLGNELAAIRESQKQNRSEMSETFQLITTGKMPMPKYPDTYKPSREGEMSREDNSAWYNKASQAFARHMDITENAAAAHHDVSHAVHVAIQSRGKDVLRAA